MKKGDAGFALLLLKENNYWPVPFSCQSLENISVTGISLRVKLWQSPWFLWIKQQRVKKTDIHPCALVLLSIASRQP